MLILLPGPLRRTRTDLTFGFLEQVGRGRRPSSAGTAAQTRHATGWGRVWTHSTQVHGMPPADSYTHVDAMNFGGIGGQLK
jgi:hypothetical protein